MTELSLAAQAMLDAVGDDCIHPDDKHRIAAAALRAAADQVVPEMAHPDAEEWLGYSTWVQVESRVRLRLLAIAEELKVKYD